MSEARPVVLLGGAIAITAVFLARFRPALLLLTETARPALAAVAVVLAMLAVGTGSLIAAQRLFGREIEREIPLLDAFIVGFPTFGTLIAIVAWTGVAMHAVIAVITFALAAGGALIMLRRRLCLPRVSPLLVIPIVIAVIEAITPVNSPDELAYKLAVPHAYDMAGRMFEMPFSSHSYITMALQLADLAALVLGGGIAAKLAHLALYFAALAVIHRLTQSKWCVAIVAWTPALLLIAGWAWSEWGLLALLLLSFDRFFEFIPNAASDLSLHRQDCSGGTAAAAGDPSPVGNVALKVALSPLSAAIAFAALGGALASKYTALPWLLAFAIIAVIRTRDVKFLARGAIVVALFGGFFYVRNTVWTGSPLAPLLLPNAPHVYNYKSGGMFSGWGELVRGADVFDAGIIDESLGILLPLAAICGLFALASRDRRLRDLAWIGAIQMPILITIAPGSRNIVNGVVPLALAGGAAMGEIWRDTRKATRGLLAITAAIAFAAQLILAIFVLESYDMVPYLAGKETARAYVNRVRDFAPVFSWIEAHSSPEARILILGENRTYDLDRQTIAAGNLDGPRIAAWLAPFPNADALRTELRRQHVTHVLLHPAWMHAPRTMMEREYTLDLPPQTNAVLQALLRDRLTLVYRDRSYLLFAVSPMGPGDRL